MTDTIAVIRNIPVSIYQMIAQPFVFFSTLRGISEHKRSIILSIVIGCIALLVRFGIDLPNLPKLSVFILCMVLFPLMCIAINCGTGFLCYRGWKYLGSPESYPVAHACVAYISILIPLTIILNRYFESQWVIVINYTLSALLYSIASIKTHSISPRKAIPSIVGIVAVQLALYFSVAGPPKL